MGGAYLSRWACQTSDSGTFKPHSDIITGLSVSQTLQNVISCDARGTVMFWSFHSGSKALNFECGSEKGNVTVMVTDQNARRLIFGFSNGQLKTASITTGSILYDTTIKNCGSISFIVQGPLNNIKYIVCECGRGQIVLFEDLPGNKMKLVRIINAHTEQISSVIMIKSTLILSLGSDKEMFSWTPKSVVPHVKYVVDSPTCACDLELSEDSFVVGDIKGNIHFYNISSPNCIKTIVPFTCKRRFSITCITSDDNKVAVGNSGGYISLLKLKNDTISTLFEHRCNVESVLYLSISRKYRTVITSGDEQDIKLFSFDGPFIGQIGFNRHFDVSDSKSWAENCPLEFDPDDFVEKNPENSENSEEKETKTDEEMISEETKAVVEDSDDDYQPVTFSAINFGEMTSVLDSIDEVYKSGNDAANFARKSLRIEKKDEEKRSSSLMTFDSFFSDNHAESNYHRIEALMGKKQNIPKFLSPSKKKKLPS